MRFPNGAALVVIHASIMALIWVTIAYEKPHALYFAMTIMGLGLTGRWVARHREEIRDWAEKRAPTLVEATGIASERLAASAAAVFPFGEGARAAAPGSSSPAATTDDYSKPLLLLPRAVSEAILSSPAGHPPTHRTRSLDSMRT